MWRNGQSFVNGKMMIRWYAPIISKHWCCGRVRGNHQFGGKRTAFLDLSAKLLNTLMLWVRKKHCPHYFIPEWNLFDCTMKESRCDDTIETLRILANVRHLTEWFRFNYVSNVFNYSNAIFESGDHIIIPYGSWSWIWTLHPMSLTKIFTKF